MLNRRDLLQRLGIGLLAANSPRLCLARTNSEERFVLVVLRGAVDGLALAAPYGDGNYSKVRGELALSKPGRNGGLLKLDGMFGLHPALPNVYDAFENEEAILVHALASPYRQRSHFDGQDVLENGVLSAGGKRDGWLNRALKPLGGNLGHESAIALSQNTPLVLRGKNSTTSWAPSRLDNADVDTLRRLEAIYADDEFFRARLAQALDAQEIAGEMGGVKNSRRRGNDAAQFKATMEQAANFLTAQGGPQIAVVESGGWDTHANQGAERGSLANKFGALDQGLATLKQNLGDAWRNTVVAVVTEFGRTVEVNGTRGTDHGTATAALLLGGAVEGGKIVADWPGLASKNLYEGRDLYPTTDLRSLFKGILAHHLDIPEAFIERDVFPDSQNARLMQHLIKA